MTPGELAQQQGNALQGPGALSGLGLLEEIFGLGASQTNDFWAPREPDEDGWSRYTPGSLPPDKALCLFKRDDGEPWGGYAGFYPEFNIAYLKWKLTGIAKEGL